MIIRRLFVLLALAASSAVPASAQVAVAPRFACALTEWDAKGGKWAETWAGDLALDGSPEKALGSLIVWKGGSTDFRSIGYRFSEPKTAGALKPHDGRTVIGLHLFEGRLTIDLGRVAASDKKNRTPTDAIAWAPAGTAELGVGLKERKVVCRGK